MVVFFNHSNQEKEIVSHITTGDVTWFSHVNPEMKKQSKELKISVQNWLKSQMTGFYAGGLKKLDS